MTLTHAGETPLLPTVVFPGGLTPLEHAIAEARRWQLEQVPDPSGIPSRVSTVIMNLLNQYPTDELERIYRKAGLLGRQTPPRTYPPPDTGTDVPHGGASD